MQVNLINLINHTPTLSPTPPTTTHAYKRYLVCLYVRVSRDGLMVHRDKRDCKS